MSQPQDPGVQPDKQPVPPPYQPYSPPPGGPQYGGVPSGSQPYGGQPQPPYGGQPQPPYGGQPQPPYGGQPQPPYGGQPSPQYPPQYYPPGQQPPPGYYPGPQPVVRQKGGVPVWVWIIGGIFLLCIVGVYFTVSTIAHGTTTILATAASASSSLASSGVAGFNENNSTNIVKGKVGDTLSSTGYKLTVNKTEKANSYNSVLKPKEGLVILAVQVTIQSDTDQGLDVSPIYARLNDDKGRKYNISFIGKDPSFPSESSLTKGKTATGWISFEVPPDAGGLVFTYAPLFGDVQFQVPLS